MRQARRAGVCEVCASVRVAAARELGVRIHVCSRWVDACAWQTGGKRVLGLLAEQRCASKLRAATRWEEHCQGGALL